MTTNKHSWTKAHSEVEDQRHIILPPAWAQNASGVTHREEGGNTILESGPNGHVASQLVNLLEQAENVAVVSSFLLADKRIEEAMLAAAKRGIRVYALIASETRLGKEPGQGEFDQHVVKEHKAMLQRLAGYVLFRSASQFHAKFILIDPRHEPEGILLTANLTKEALDRNDELAVRLTPDQAMKISEYARWAMWERAEHEYIDPRDQFRAVQPLELAEHPVSEHAVVATSEQTKSLRESALALINHAQSELIVSSFGWDVDHPVVDALCKKAREGLAVNVLARVRPASMPALIKLADAGALIHGYKWLHAKAICVDGCDGMVMSANLQHHGLDEGFEMGVLLHGNDAIELQTRLTGWLDASPWKLLVNAERGEALGAIQLWSNDKLTDSKILQSAIVELEDVTAASAENLLVSRPPYSGASPLAHAIEYQWNVHAPTLAPNAKPVKYKEKKESKNGKSEPQALPALYKEPNGRIVVAVQTPSQLTAAQQLRNANKAKAVVVTKGAEK